MKNNKEKRKQFLEATGKIISKKRKKKNISQKELAQNIGVDKSTVARYEKGTLDMPLSTLPLISDYCGFELRDYLISWEEKGVKQFVYDSLSKNSNSPDDVIVQEYIDSCSNSELSDLKEISQCVSLINDQEYKRVMTDLIVEIHMNRITNNNFKRLKLYYDKINHTS